MPDQPNAHDALAVALNVQPCDLGVDHVGVCDDCGETAQLGWAHLCRPCWDAHIAEVARGSV